MLDDDTNPNLISTDIDAHFLCIKFDGTVFHLFGRLIFFYWIGMKSVLADWPVKIFFDVVVVNYGGKNKHAKTIN